MPKQLLFYVFLIIVVLTVVETASYVAGKYIFPSHVIFSPSFSERQKTTQEFYYTRYLELREPVLGWPSEHNITMAKEGPRELDPAGSRFVPAFPDPEKYPACVSIYGDSYTLGSEVEDEDAWGNVLSTMLNCRVNNFGVGGYGSDQAYLRYLTISDDTSPLVFINHLSENILRNVNRFRSILAGYDGSEKLSFKPRFIIDDHGKLELLSIPTFEVSEYNDVLIDPGKYLPHEYFVPGGDSGLVHLRFPYTLALLRTLNQFHVRAWMRNIP
jgi:hypothetical protein